MKLNLSGSVLAFVFWPLISCANTAAENNQAATRSAAERPAKKRLPPNASTPSSTQSRLSGSSTAASSSPVSRQMDADYLRGRVDQCMQMLPTEKMCQSQIMNECQKGMSASDCQALMNQYRGPGM